MFNFPLTKSSQDRQTLQNSNEKQYFKMFGYYQLDCLPTEIVC